MQFGPKFVWPKGRRAAWHLAECYLKRPFREQSSLAQWIAEWGINEDLSVENEEQFFICCLAQSIVEIAIAGIIDDDAVSRLRSVLDGRSKVSLRHWSGVEEILCRDEAGIYEKLHEETRVHYRRVVDTLENESKIDRIEIATRAVQSSINDSYNPIHVGERLIGALTDSFRAQLGCASREKSDAAAICIHLVPRLMAGCFAAVVVGVCLSDAYVISILVAVISSFTIAYETAAVISDEFITASRIATPLVAVEYVKSGLPEKSAVAIAVPLLLINKQQIAEAVRVAKGNIVLANDTNVSLVLLTDFADSQRGYESEEELDLLCFTISEVQRANEQLGQRFGNPIAVAHRERVWNETEKLYWGKNRKSGKLLALCKMMNSGINSEFCRGTPNLDRAVFKKRYLLILDEDSVICRDTVQLMAGFMDHPCNMPVVENDRVVRGHGAAVGAGLHLAAGESEWTGRSMMPGMMLSPGESAPQMGDRQYDHFGIAKFTGKGMVDPNVYLRVCENIPYEYVLSHDVFEAGYLRPGFVVRAGTIDSFPSSLEALAKRDERWLRGDLQNAYIVLASWLGKGPLSPRKYPALAGYLILSQCIPWLAAASVLPLGWVLAVDGTSGDPLKIAILICLVSSPALLKFFSSLRMRLPSSAADLRTAMSHTFGIVASTMLKLIFAVEKALVVIEATGKVAWRLHTRTHLLEWSASSSGSMGAPRRFHSMLSLPMAGALLFVDRAPISILTVVLVGGWALAPLIPRLLARRK
jgi:hypothetical protein